MAGFTLLEMLLVVAIVGILAVVAIGNFGGITRSVKLDLATDNIVSLIKLQQGKASGGVSENGDKEGGIYCYGIKFRKVASADGGKQVENQVQLAKVPYLRVGTDRADVCDFQSVDESAYLGPANFDSSSDVELTAIRAGDQDAGELYLLFKPPFAKATVRGEGGSEIASPGTVTLEIKSVYAEEMQYIDFSPATGLIKKYKKENDPEKKE